MKHLRRHPRLFYWRILLLLSWVGALKISAFAPFLQPSPGRAHPCNNNLPRRQNLDRRHRKEVFAILREPTTIVSTKMTNSTNDNDNEVEITTPTSHMRRLSSPRKHVVRSTTPVSTTIAPMIVALVAWSLTLALALLAWEDLTCTYVLPSRHRTSLEYPLAFGRSTIGGMGFGADQRRMLQDVDPHTQDLRSYNEVLLEHRLLRVPQWKKDANVAMESPTTTPAAIHTLVQSLQSTRDMQTLAADYQWESLRTRIYSDPWDGPLGMAASELRALASSRNDVAASSTIGFDWGSCAWRHCGALADAQEALDELDTLMGVLEPPEALFCLDVVERSIREMLASVMPWKLASVEDLQVWNDLPDYQPRQGRSESNADSMLDDEYLKALQELRIE
jgi:hypothetical protein